MKSPLLLVFLFICSLYSVSAQNISISAEEKPPGSADTVFRLENGALSVSENQLLFGEREFYNPHSWAASTDGHKISILLRERQFIYKLFDSNGILYFDQDLEFFNLEDETAKNYQFDDGRSVLRDNVANFTFYSSQGDQLFSISNSSQSSEGERQSELASDKGGNTIVLYNPVINYGSSTGSRASLVTKERELRTFFRDREREINKVEVTPSGTFISVIIKPASGSDEYSVLLFDRFGNRLFELTTEEDLIGTTLHNQTQYLTIYSSRRVQVYDIKNSERIGSASSTSSILFADYDPGTQTVIALGGNMENLRIRDPEITAVSISKREIARQEVPFTISALNLDRLTMSVAGTNSYTISGLNQDLLVEVAF